MTDNDTIRDEFRAEDTAVKGHHVSHDLYEFVLSDGFSVTYNVKIQGFIEELDAFIDQLKTELKKMKSHERSIKKANEKLDA